MPLSCTIHKTPSHSLEKLQNRRTNQVEEVDDAVVVVPIGDADGGEDGLLVGLLLGGRIVPRSPLMKVARRVVGVGQTDVLQVVVVMPESLNTRPVTIGVAGVSPDQLHVTLPGGKLTQLGNYNIAYL